MDRRTFLASSAAAAAGAALPAVPCPACDAPLPEPLDVKATIDRQVVKMFIGGKLIYEGPASFVGPSELQIPCLAADIPLGETIQIEFLPEEITCFD